ncbi:MAG: hypothetical protein NVS9B12_00680 [Vulcanimicrobiaceae bacterium]
MPTRKLISYAVNEPPEVAGGRLVHPCDRMVRVKSTGSPAGPRRGILRDVTDVDREPGGLGTLQNSEDVIQFFFD